MRVWEAIERLKIRDQFSNSNFSAQPAFMRLFQAVAFARRSSAGVVHG